MFGPALHPAVSLPTSSSLGASAGPSPFVAGETMFPQPNPDFLRRELDTRFLVSHERTLGIHPPPLHQHQHQHNHLHHQHSSFLPPPHLGSPLVPPQPPTARLYDKFPKLEGPLYSRNTFGLPSYAGMSPILSGGASLFTPPAHIPGFQPKMNPLVKTKNMKSGRWCAMHIRIAWEIYHHQQQQSEVHKPGATGSASNKNPADPLRPPVHMLPHSVPRPHDFHMSLLLNAAGTTPGRTPFEGSSHPGTFLNPAAAHLSLPPFARPSYSGFGGPSNSFGGISSLGLGSSGVFTSRDSGLSNLSVASQDPWTHLHRNPLSIPTPLGSGVTSNPAPWGGLKAEAERERLHREDQERERKLDRKVDREREKEKQRKAELEKERREREISEKNKAIDRERKENERQKEREREIRTFHQINSTETPPNGEIVERNRNKERDLENSRDRRDRGNSRSPVRHGREVNMDSALDNTSFLIKQESRLKEQNPQEGTPNALATTSLAGISERDRIRTLEAHHSERGGNYMMKSVGPTTIKPVDHARLLEGIAVVPDGSSSERMTATLISPPVCSTITNTIASTRSRRDLYKPFDFTIPRNLDREQFFQRYAALNSVMFHERFREPEFSRQFSASSSGYNFFREGDHSLLYEREKHSVDRTKLIPPPPLRSTETHFPSSIGLSGKCHPSSVGFPNSGMTKNGSPANFVSAVPPPLIPCSTGPSDCSSLPNPSHVVQRSNRGSPPLVSSKLGQNSVAHLENSHDPFFNKEKQNETLHPTEVSSLPR
ncbi:uncharacterized protein LOC143255516 [Tachypleus tridentatus]|uniref:uncharacterized protein LOC143255516 n=1 Tax=Tachypleus tridentatus TaxID=6853 RepID=UPI003FD2477B